LEDPEDAISVSDTESVAWKTAKRAAERDVFFEALQASLTLSAAAAGAMRISSAALPLADCKAPRL